MKIFLRLIASTALALIMGSTCFGRHYSRIKGMRVLSSRNVSPKNVDYTAGLTARVYFTAGPSHGSGGLFGYLPVGSLEDHVGQASPQSPRSISKMYAHIRSTPAGADILVDNGYVGTTPLDIDLTCCWHDVTLPRLHERQSLRSIRRRRP
jgi:PEGA domain